ncbi:hypothetical protein S40288_02221, partial [Stachybotrys chartarum IBT 40288]
FASLRAAPPSFRNLATHTPRTLYTPFLRPFELPRRLTFTTSSSKKRKLSRPLSEDDPSSGSSPNSDTVLPSSETDDDNNNNNPALSFSAASFTYGSERAASSLPPRLQNQPADSAASSPCASAYAELSLDTDGGADETGSVLNQARSQSPLTISRRAIMGGHADLPQRSSSPLKRRASSMDPEADVNKGLDGAMDTSQEQSNDPDHASPSVPLPRDMSVDAIDLPEAPATTASENRESLLFVSTGPHASPEESATANHQSAAAPSLLVQVKTIKTLLEAFAETPPKEGDKAYLVSRSWVDKALSLHTDPQKTKTELPEEPLGPVDNSDIIEEAIAQPNGEIFVRLTPGSGMDSFELFPEDAWKLVVEWHGLKEAQHPIVRYAVNAADDETGSNILYEFHPPVFRVHRVWSEMSPLPIEQTIKANKPPPLVLARSRNYRFYDFVKEIKQSIGVPLDRKVRLWTIDRQLPVGGNAETRSALTPPDSPGRAGDELNPQDSWSTLLIDVISFAQVREHRTLRQDRDHTVNPNYNGRSTLQQNAFIDDATIVVEEAIDNEWVSTYVNRSRSPKNGNLRAGPALPLSKSDSGRASPALSGPITRGRAQQKRSIRTVGSVGFSNLGNTCYMNSAVQCVRSVEELTKYFLTDTYKAEINKGNKLGHGGRIAVAYGSLLREIYEAGKGSVAPRNFKHTVGSCRATFQGWAQHDSHEFLAFLLDALQEDLNRIEKKPYIEKPDSTDDMINDPQAIREMADKVWDITRQRDDSVIADLFTGMYKSTLKCPDCGKISITFDPFNNLTLQLPVEDMWSASIKFFPLNDTPVLIEVEMPKHRTIEALKQILSAKTGVPVDRLMGGEEFKDRFFKLYEDKQDASEEIQNNDVPTMHELEAAPTNLPNKSPKKKIRSMLDITTPPEGEWDDPRYERMLVPVIHRRPQGYSRSDGSAPPHFIVLTKEEARDQDSIRRKILEKVATFSTWYRLTENDDADAADGDMVMTTASDADSSVGSKVAAASVEGEDDIVDVTMKDSIQATVSNSASAGDDSQILRRFNSSRPRFISKGTFLKPELQNLFDIAYFTEDKDTVPSGWTRTENTILPRLSDRIPEPSIEEDEASQESWNGTASGNDDSSADDDPKAEPSLTRMVEESSDEDAQSSIRTNPRSMQNFGPGGRKKFKNHKTYGKKGNKRRDKQMRNNKHAQRMPAVKPQPMPPAVADGGPLVRLGEGLVVEWHEEAWNMVFGGGIGDPKSIQGAPTCANLEVLADPSLKLSQRRRKTRRSQGLTLEECLDEFERAEVLSEQDMWYCPRCKEHRQASKKLTLWKTPDILVVHLKRFSNSGWRREKLDVMVDFPVESLDLTTRVIQKEDGKGEIYDLIGVDNHFGGLSGGHYTAYAKNFADGEWYEYDDSHVRPVRPPSKTVTSAAYLLFYRRRSEGPLGGPRFAEIFQKYNNSDEDDEAGSGDDQQLNGGSSLNGSLSAGAGAAAVHHHTDHGLVSTRTTALADDEDDEGLPPYDGLSHIHHSIEDEGVEMADRHQGPQSLGMTQGWNFDGLEDSGAEGGYASNDAQLDSSADERDPDAGFFDQDADMTVDGTPQDLQPAGPPPAPDGNAQIALADIQNAAWERKGVLSVPAVIGSDGDSDEVAEIHLEGGGKGRSG